MPSDWRGGCHTETGRVRSLNEDAVLELPEERLWAVADGMGGHANGDYASAQVVGGLSRYRRDRRRGVALVRIETLLGECNRHLIEEARRRGGDIIGCTVAVLSLHGARAAVCSWCGDSRVYRLRDGALRQLTRDHDHRALHEDRDRLRHPDLPPMARHGLTDAIGGRPELRLEHCWYALRSDDRFLLCTDGLYKELSDEEIRDALASTMTVGSALERLVVRYRSRGARDNVALVHVRGA